MTQLTVRDADKHLGNAPKQEAEARGWSANKLFLQLLRESVGLLPQSRPAVYTGLDPWRASGRTRKQRSLSSVWLSNGRWTQSLGFAPVIE